jgi:hypothetical protein
MATHPAAEHHTKAAEHHEQAAEHYAEGNNEKAAEARAPRPGPPRVGHRAHGGSSQGSRHAPRHP